MRGATDRWRARPGRSVSQKSWAWAAPGVVAAALFAGCGSSSPAHGAGSPPAAPGPGGSSTGCRTLAVIASSKPQSTKTTGPSGGSLPGQLLVSRSGTVENAKGCAVLFRGVAWEGFEDGDANAPDQQVAQAVPALATKLTAALHSNLVLVPVDATWWNDNIHLPGIGVPYQVWIEQAVSWILSAEDDVLLAPVPGTPTPPCGGSVTACPGPGGASVSPAFYQATGTEPSAELDAQVSTMVSFWTSTAFRYETQPRVIFDAWDGLPATGAAWSSAMGRVLSAIHSGSPTSLVMVGGTPGLLDGSVAPPGGAGVLIGVHISPGDGSGDSSSAECSEAPATVWSTWSKTASKWASYARTHGQALVFEEWGECGPVSSFDSAISSFATSHDAGLVYHDLSGLVGEPLAKAARAPATAKVPLSSAGVDMERSVPKVG